MYCNLLFFPMYRKSELFTRNFVTPPIFDWSIRCTPKVPAMFMFGDSLVDNGNNNYYLSSLAKANYYPYGIDFFQGLTQRFCQLKDFHRWVVQVSILSWCATMLRQLEASSNSQAISLS